MLKSGKRRRERDRKTRRATGGRSGERDDKDHDARACHSPPHTTPATAPRCVSPAPLPSPCRPVGDRLMHARAHRCARRARRPPQRREPQRPSAHTPGVRPTRDKRNNTCDLGRPQVQQTRPCRLAHKYFFALARTRASKTALRIGVCAVWNGFNIVCHPNRLVSADAVDPSGTHLNIQLPHIEKERSDALVVPRFVQQDKLHVCTTRSALPQTPHAHNVLPGVTNADTVHSLNLSTDLRYLYAPSTCAIPELSASAHIRLSLRITSSITSRLALATICITCLSFPPPMRAPPPCTWYACAALGAPESAVNVPANAEVDQLGRFAARGDVVLGAGFEEKCASS